jgi:hypothetical protein
VLQERFAAKPDEERLIELETLRQYLEEGKEAVDIAVASNISAVERMKKLLTAPDKKAMILEMAEVGGWQLGCWATGWLVYLFQHRLQCWARLYRVETTVGAQPLADSGHIVTIWLQAA